MHLTTKIITTLCCTFAMLHCNASLEALSNAIKVDGCDNWFAKSAAAKAGCTATDCDTTGSYKTIWVTCKGFGRTGSARTVPGLQDLKYCTDEDGAPYVDDPANGLVCVKGKVQRDEKMPTDFTRVP